MYPKLECHLAQEQEVQHEILWLFVSKCARATLLSMSKGSAKPSVLSLIAAHQRCTENFPLCFLPQFKDLQFSDTF